MKPRLIKTLLLSCFLSIASVAASHARDVTLSWSPVTDPSVTGYKVYYNPDSAVTPFKGTGSTLGPAPIDVKKLSSTTVTGLDPSKSYYFAVTAYNASGTESAYSNIASIAEGVAPTTAITFPAANAALSGTVSVTANATDNVGVTKVEFYVNGALAATDTATPYVYSWNTSTLAAGAYTLMTKAYDAAGNVGQSSTVAVTVVKDTTPPTVSVMAPANNATLSGTVSLTASASDNVGVSKVEFYNGTALLFASNVAPYSYSWNTTSVTDGSYTLSAKAYDNAGNVAQSSTVAVAIKNTAADTVAPTVSITSPAFAASVSGKPTVTVSATDNVGVSKVEFYVNNVLKTTATAAPYSFSWDTTSGTNGSYAIAAKAYDAAGNVGQSTAVLINVNNPAAGITAPNVSVTAPSFGASVSGIANVTVSATDNVGVSKVEFYVNNVLKTTATAAPYTFSWDTTSVINGTYAIAAKAYNAAGNVGQSMAILVTVNNSTTPPAASVTAVFGNASGSNYPNTVEDTFLNINNDVNATSTTLGTYTWPANKPSNAILMKWALSALPANAQIQSATLSLYMTGSGGDDQYEIPVSEVINKSPIIANCNGNTYDGINAWTASSVPYGGIPLAQSDIAAVVDAPLIDTTPGYKSWNVTNIVKDWVTTSSNNKGLLLDSSSKATADSYRVFASSEATDATQRPKLVVTYVLK